jgi:prenyltransferase/squalene oxidase-like repeat protein
MSWQLGSFLILTAVLLGGFAWYERSRPPSQVVALVAVLAALAIAGRIAFAAFPNVKPTTDIVVFAGYALGPAPGFAVGALAGLVSNFWFGQGPWTPWQMLGWGICGVLGALLALGSRNIGRFTLAAACGLVGIAYGVLLNFSLMATYGGDLSLERFLALEARAVPFDAAHALGNVAFALVAGPAMIRMLTRFRQRFEWRTPAVATALLVALLLPAIVPSPASADTDRAVSWLEAQQNADGGFGASPGDPSSAAITGWAMLGFEAGDRHPLDVTRRGRSPVDFLRANIDEVSSPGDLARTIVALEGAGVNPRSFGGRNLVGELLDRRAANGSYVGWPGTTSFSAVALRTAGASGAGLEGTLSWLAKVQNPDGGWGDVPDQPSNADVTGSVMQAMPNTDAARQGLGYLRRHQRSGGGFALGTSGAVNTQSTAWAVQGMIAIGADPARIEAGGRSALGYIASLQAENGHYRYSASSDQTPVWVTGQVLVAAAHASLPIAPPAREKETTAVSPPAEVTESDAAITPPAPETAPEQFDSGGIPTEPAPALPDEGAAPSPGPPLGGTIPIPESEASAPEPEAPAAKPVQASGSASSPAAPIGIGLAGTALAIAAPWWLGRRFGW